MWYQDKLTGSIVGLLNCDSERFKKQFDSESESFQTTKLMPSSLPMLSVIYQSNLNYESQ